MKIAARFRVGAEHPAIPVAPGSSFVPRFGRLWVLDAHHQFARFTFGRLLKHTVIDKKYTSNI